MTWAEQWDKQSVEWAAPNVQSVRAPLPLTGHPQIRAESRGHSAPFRSHGTFFSYVIRWAYYSKLRFGGVESFFQDRRAGMHCWAALIIYMGCQKGLNMCCGFAWAPGTLIGKCLNGVETSGNSWKSQSGVWSWHCVHCLEAFEV